MSFQQLNKDELADIAEFFVVDVEAADAEKGPTKKELLAALAAGDEPVTFDQYKEIYLAAKASETPEVVEQNSEELHEPAPVNEPAEDVDTSDYVLVKFEGKNPTMEVVGYTFTVRHPFQSVPPRVAEYLVRNQPAFRLAMPSEVTDYYG